MYKLLTTITLATLAILITTGVRAASERRAEYLNAEAAYFECIESGLDRAECVAGVGL